MELFEMYNKRKNKYEKLALKLTQYYNYLAVSRLLVFILCSSFTVYFYIKKLYYIDISIILIFIILYLMLLKIHNKISYHKDLCMNIISINEDSINRVKGDWVNFKDKGDEFIDEKHPYSDDLDIFGKGSLYQYINSTFTFIGKETMRDTLTKINFLPEEIYHRQHAVDELAKKIGWRQRFLAEGNISLCDMKNPDELIKWGNEKSHLGLKSNRVFLIKYIPIVTLLIIFIFFVTNIISVYVPLAAMMLQIFLVYYKKGERVELLESISLYKKDILIYSNLLNIIEKFKFKSYYLKTLKAKLYNEKNRSAAEQINSFVKLVNLISDRNNFFYIVLNIMLLWDYQCIFALDKWKMESGSQISKWLHVIGELEALSSISIIRHDNSEWAMPKFNEKSLIIDARKIGHPLINKNRVCNDLIVGKNEKIILITGSNMSGKSTMLRTVGVNLVLAYAGAPVCAESFCCSIMNIYTCMRTSDNIEQNISSFYAELLKIKSINAAVKNKENVLFILDEIFKGTNSFDRHTGAEILINKLSKESVIGFVSTHDLELGDLEKRNSKIKNYHFEEYYKNNKIFFDYKLREGVSTTRNALYLMKLAGIDTD